MHQRRSSLENPAVTLSEAQAVVVVVATVPIPVMAVPATQVKHNAWTIRVIIRVAITTVAVALAIAPMAVTAFAIVHIQTFAVRYASFSSGPNGTYWRRLCRTCECGACQGCGTRGKKCSFHCIVSCCLMWGGNATKSRRFRHTNRSSSV